MKTLVIVPAYNEEECIGGVISDLRDNFLEGDILVVNDGSQDRTSEIAKEHGARVIDLVVTRYTDHRGYAVAGRTDMTKSQPAVDVGIGRLGKEGGHEP